MNSQHYMLSLYNILVFFCFYNPTEKHMQCTLPSFTPEKWTVDFYTYVYIKKMAKVNSL